ncbi:MAG: crossover junction endodeoxyribonuclease RuvC [Patescibacteria group bacterium]|nr:crossover junction endodeoxyribonuclease RuvC [Patescibacteria group bacterium]
MIVIGIDPGIANTGFGVVDKNQNSKSKNKIKCLGYGLIETASCLPTTERLKKINNDLNKVINKYNPEVLAIENVYFFKNLKTAMPVSQAKGVIMFTAAKKRIPVYEFTPLQVKMAITGYGKAEKKQIQKMVKILLDLKEIPKPDDVADAIAIAMAYCFVNPSFPVQAV